MSTPSLFSDIDVSEKPKVRPPVDLGVAPRLRRPNRVQMLMRPCTLDELLDDDHDARLVWDLVETWNLTQFLEVIRARGELPGRAATDPRLLVALWLYAATQGVAGGRELARLCESTDAYRWLCGTVPVNYHMLNDFRVEHEAALKNLLTQMLAVLIRGGLVGVQRIAQDGTRVRAGARYEKLQATRDDRAGLAAGRGASDDHRPTGQEVRGRDRTASGCLEAGGSHETSPGRIGEDRGG